MVCHEKRNHYLAFSFIFVIYMAGHGVSLKEESLPRFSFIFVIYMAGHGVS